MEILSTISFGWFALYLIIYAAFKMFSIFSRVVNLIVIFDPSSALNKSFNKSVSKTISIFFMMSIIPAPPTTVVSIQGVRQRKLHMLHAMRMVALPKSADLCVVPSYTFHILFQLYHSLYNRLPFYFPPKILAYASRHLLFFGARKISHQLLYLFESPCKYG